MTQKSKTKSKPKESDSTGSLGCRAIAVSGLIMISLLIVNVIFVRAFFSDNLSGLDDRLFQASQFVLPIIMLFIEYWIFDNFISRQKRF